MSNVRDSLKKTIASLERTSSVHVQGEALDSMINTIQGFVNAVEEEKTMVSQISSIENELRELKRQKSNEDLSLEDQRGIDANIRESEATLAQARKVKGELDRKKAVIKALQSKVGKLYQDINKAA